MPGRTFTSPADFNTQFGEWLQRANQREVRTIKARPIDLIDADRAKMLAMPPIPLHLGWRERVRLGRDYYVRLDTGDYSVESPDSPGPRFSWKRTRGQLNDYHPNPQPTSPKGRPSRGAR